MLPTASNEIRSSEHETSQARPSHPGKLSRLVFILRPLWYSEYYLQKPRRSIDRDLQERWPTDYPI